jgi:haloalkane dehalogenase
MPWQLNLCRNTALGAFLIRGFNAFAAGTARDCVTRKLPKDVYRAYVAPYDSWAHRISTLRFVQDIPLAEGDPAWGLVKASADRLSSYVDRPAFIGWGLQDFVFDRHFLDGFRSALPQAEVQAFEDAHHYVLEDKHEVLVPAMRRFLDAHPL